MDHVQAMRAALDAVPVTLLSSDETRVFDGISSSLDIVERSDALEPVVVLVGPTGSGKSFLFNALVRPDASSEGVLRPTTSNVVVAGDPSASLLERVPDLVVVPAGDAHFVVIDTPGLDADPGTVSGAIASADLVVLVVSPIRYADAAVTQLWGELDASGTVLVLNRVTARGADASDLLESVLDVFGHQPHVVEEGGDGSSALEAHLSEILAPGRERVTSTIMVKAAVAGARFVVRAVTSAARDIGRVTVAVQDLAGCEIDVSMYPVQMSWEGTRDAMVAAIGKDVRDRDDLVIATSGTALAERMFEDMGRWDEADLVDALDAWRDKCVATFTDRASIRWRRSNALQIVGRFSWSTAINQDVAAPGRFSRIMGSRMEEATREMRSELEALLCREIDGRVQRWTAALDELGEYQPGLLASAADALERGRSQHV